MPHSDDTAFADWLRKVFDHPVQDPEWYWDENTDTSEPAPEATVAFLTRLFEDPEPVLAPYTDAQINQGLWYLASHSCSNHACRLVLPDVPWPQRRRGIRSVATLFEKLFARRCTDHLLHLDEAGANPLNSVCYIWWDTFAACGRPVDADQADVAAELIAVMVKTLALDSLACQESALHGLGHWQLHHSEAVRPAIEEFLEREDVRPELRTYAEHAWHGYVQ